MTHSVWKVFIGKNAKLKILVDVSERFLSRPHLCVIELFPFGFSTLYIFLYHDLEYVCDLPGYVYTKFYFLIFVLKIVTNISK